jgi:hypothetical protein
MRWLVSKVISNEYYRAALSESELEYRKNLENEYKNDIGFAKLMLAENPKFKELSLEEKTTTNMIQKTSPIFAVNPLISKEI